MNEKTKRPGLIKSAIRACARWADIPIDGGDLSAWNLPFNTGDIVPGFPHRNAAGQCVSETTALSLSSVWACVSLLSDTISTLPIGFYKRTQSGRILADSHSLFRVLRRQPNADMTSAQLIGATIANMLLTGMGYWEKDISGGRTIGLTFLPSNRMSRSLKSNGEYEYRYTFRGKQRVIPLNRLVRIPGFSLDGENGLSAIAFGANMFGNAQAAETAAGGTFKRGLLPTVYFKYPTVLKAEQRKDAREMIGKISGAINAGDPVIMEAGMEAGSLGINPHDAQLLESRAFSVEEICSWFRVQPFMIGRAAQGQTNWGTGIEQQMIGFITFTLAPWLRRIEQAIEKDLLAPDEKGAYYAEFALDGLLRGDSNARQSFFASALQNGWMNRNEVRALQNLPPIEGGDVYTVQSNLIEINNMGDVAPAAGARSALLNWLQMGSENV